MTSVDIQKPAHLERPSPERQMKAWTNLSLHRAFIEDDVRNQAYMSALEASVSPDCTVVDIGTGTGLLSFLALRAGAARVLGIDWSSMVEGARETAERNGCDERVQFMKADARSVRIGDHRFLDLHPDVIVHELIGGLVWDEDFIDVLRQVRRNIAGERTVFLPSSMSVFLVPVVSPERLAEQKFWCTTHYGIDFGSFHETRASGCYLTTSSAAHLEDTETFLSEPECFAQYDFGDLDHATQRQEMQFEVTRHDIHDGYLGFMNIGFGETGPLISTHPDRPGTNWGQFLLPTPAPKPVVPGERIRVSFKPARWSADWTVETFYNVPTASN